MSRRRDCLPACLLWHEEDVVHQVGVRVVLETVAVHHKFPVLCIKRRGNVAQKNKSDDDFPVFCRRDMPPQDARRVPYLFFKANIGVRPFCHQSLPFE